MSSSTRSRVRRGLGGLLIAMALATSIDAQPPRQRPDPPRPPLAVTPAETPLPAGVLARVNGEDVTLERYKDFLYRERYLDRFLNLVDEILLAKKAEELGVEVTQKELEDLVDRQMQNDIEKAYRGDRELFVASLARRFRTIESHRQWQIQQHRRRLLIDRCVIQTRQIQEDDVKKAFERIYGVGGVHFQVRHIVLRKRRSAAGGAQRDLMAEAQQIMAELEKDPGQFVELVKKYSEDAMTKNNEGFIPSYRKELFGTTVHDVVISLSQEGEIGGPVESDYGVHIVQLVKKTLTRYDEVKDELREELQQGRPTGGETATFLKDLRSGATIEM